MHYNMKRGVVLWVMSYQCSL